jgi:class 3 adenylate cyclase/tetratricopeptide (TPR) repeat protein
MSLTGSDSRVQKYVPSVAAEWDLDAGGRTWRELDGTLCFIDISGFTSLAERLAAFGRIGAEELSEVLNRVFSSMIELAYERGAVQLKFGGDALLLMFTSAEHAHQACAAAVEMRAALRETARWTTSVGRLKLRMSVGIHSGRINLFRVGRSHHELVISGPAATATTHMESTADAGEIVVSSATRAFLPATAASMPKGQGWLLRWRRAPIAPCGFIPRRPTDPDALVTNIPTGLREHLRRGTTEAEHRSATVAFVKFSGVDDLLAERGPQSLASALDELIGAVQAAADAEEVTFLATDLDANGGKVILATGVPTAREDDAGRMLRALRRISDADLEIPVRIGVNRGHVFAGDVGSTEHRSTYTVIGDTVNLAARLMAAAPPGSIYALPTVLEASRTVFDAVPLEPFSVKGKSEPVQAYAVGDELGSRADEMQIELPLVGRGEEFELLVEAIEAVEGRVGGVVSIIGVAGIGKSRLLHEALRGAPELPVVMVTSEPFRSAVPYRPFRDTLRRLLGVQRGTAAEMAQQLRDRIREIAPDLESLLPLVGDLTHIDVPMSPEVRAIESPFLAGRVADVLEQLLELLVPGPLVLVAEDAHWMDEPTTQLLQRMVTAAQVHPWLVVSARRPDPTGFDPSDGRRIVLAPLAVTASEALVVQATRAAPLRPHDVDRLVERAQGNPLFLLEIVRALREAGSVDALPDSLDALVTTQIDSLAPLARRWLRCAAVLGGTFREAVLNEVLSGENLDVDDATRRQLDSFLERTEDDRLRFRHAVLRDVAYEGLPYRRRQALHLLAGQATERAAGGHPETVADLLALHYSRGLDRERAWKFGCIAGERATAAYANIEAATNFELALDAGRRLPSVSASDRARIFTLLGDAREQSGLFAEALDAYRRASALRRDDPRGTAELLLKRARARERSGSNRQALRETTLAYRLIEDDADPRAGRIRARLLAFTAVIRQAQEHPRQALAVAQQAIAAAQTAGELSALARAYNVADWAYRVTGLPERAVHGTDALRIYEELDDLSGQAMVMNNLGAQAYFDGHWAEAVDLYERARSAFDRAGNAVQAAIAAANVGELLVNQDRPNEAEPMLRDAVRVLRASAFVDGATFAEVQLARLLIGRRQLDEAAEILEAALADLIAADLYGSALEAAIHLADCRRLEGDPAMALHLLAEAEAQAGEDAEWQVAQLARVRALAQLESGRGEDALATLATAVRSARAQGLESELPLLLTARAEVLRELGREVEMIDAHLIEATASAPGVDADDVDGCAALEEDGLQVSG